MKIEIVMKQPNEEMTAKELMNYRMELVNNKKLLEQTIIELDKFMVDNEKVPQEREGYKVEYRSNIRWDFVKEKQEEFESMFPELVTKKFLTKGLSEEQKQTYFKKKLSTPFISISDK